MADEKKTFDLVIRATAKGVAQVTKGIANDFKRSGQAMKAFNKFAGNGKKAVGRLTGELKALVAVMVSYQSASKAVTMMAGFEQTFTEVTTLSNASAESLKGLRDEIINISKEVPQSATQLAAAEYDIISAGVALEDSAKVLKLAAKAAVAGVTDTKTAANIGVSVLNAYGLEVSELGRVYDVLFQTVRDGQTTFPELAGHIGKILPIARSAGVDLESVAAALGTMTKSGMKTEIATTALRGAIAQLASPAGAAKAKMEELGISWKGLEGTIKQIADKNLGAQALREIIPDINARTAVSSLALNYKTLEENLRGLADSAGATDTAFDKMMKTLGNRFKMIKNEIAAAILQNKDFDATLDKIVKSLRKMAPSIADLVADIVSFVSKVTLWIVENKKLVAGLLGAGGLVFAIGKIVMLIKGLSAAWAVFKGAGLAATATEATISFAGLAAGLGLIPGLLIAIGTAVAIYAVKSFYDWIQAERELKQVTGELTDAQQKLIGKTKEFADVRIPPGMLAMPTQELKTLEDQLLHTATYWKTELSQLKIAADETNWFGQATEEAVKAKAAMDGVTARWQQAEDELSRVQTELKTRTEEVTTAQRDQALAMDETAAAADRLAAAVKGVDIVDAEYALQLKELELALAREIITEEEYRQKRLEAEKAHWQKMIEIRKAALKAMAEAGKEGTKEYVEGLKAMRQAELNLIKTDKQIQGSMKKVGDSMKETGAKGKEAASTAESAWQALADKVGMTVEEMKAAITGLTSEIENAQGRISFMGTYDEEGKRASRTNSTDWGAMTYEQLKMQYDTLMRKLSSGWGGADDYDYLRIIAEKMAKLEGLTEEQTSELQKQTDLAAHRETKLSQDPHRNWMPGYAGGGRIPGVGDRDTVPAMLTPGEYVIRKSIVSRLGRGFFDALNSGVRQLPNIRLPQLPVRKFAGGGQVEPRETITVDLRIGGRNHPGAYDPDVARSLVQALRSARLTVATG